MFTEKDIEAQQQQPPSISSDLKETFAETQPLSESRWQRFKDSFKPVDLNDSDYEGMTAVEKAAAATAKSPLSRSLKARHLQMIAIGGSIGTGLFVGTGASLSLAGPAAIIISYCLIGSMLFCTVHALAELSTAMPVAGSFSTYATRFMDPAWGFSMGTNYVLQWLVALPLEIVAASMTVQFWNKEINPVAWVGIFWVAITIINFFGAKGYGEAEFVLSMVKVVAVVGFIILGIIITCGGGPQGGYIGGKYWHDPGAFAGKSGADNFKRLCSVWANSAFAFSGTELVGLAAAETKNPRRDIPKAARLTFVRILLFYVVSLTIITCLVPYNDDKLLGSSSVDVTASPFVIAIVNAGINVLPSIFNVVVLLSVLSVGNSSVYASSRTIAALAAQGQLPKFCGYIDRNGRPLTGIVLTCAFGLIAFLAGAGQSTQTAVFNWLLALSGLSAIFTWGSICFCHIRFRAGLKAQNRSTKELPFTSAVGVWGSWYGFVLNTLVLVAQFWTALFPVGAEPNASDFFEIYLAMPVAIVCYLGYKIWYRTPFIRAKDMDVDTGRREVDLDLLEQEMAEEREYLKSRGWLYRTYNYWC
ncbi:general amino-acid permease Gap1p [Trichomonascus vanleenenianus]|uniref:amino acid permease n=1 Tax=Trichomonascus vanleenenianus TaxID=2268995 RepID=UPI003ECBA2C9